MATKNTITEREIYTSIIEGTADPDVLVEFATKKLAQLDHRNEKAKERAAKKRSEPDALMDAVAGFLADEPQSRQDIFDAMVATGEYPDLKIGQVGFRLSALVKAERAVRAEASVAGADGKAKRVVVYTLA